MEVIFAKPDAAERGLARKTLLVQDQGGKGLLNQQQRREQDKDKKEDEGYGKRNKEYEAGQEVNETTREEVEGFVPTSESLVSSDNYTPKKIPNKKSRRFVGTLNLAPTLHANCPHSALPCGVVWRKCGGLWTYVQRTIPNAHEYMIRSSILNCEPTYHACYFHNSTNIT